jgi:hypothetical protein
VKWLKSSVLDKDDHYTHVMEDCVNNLRFLPTRMHAIMDYLIGIVLFLAPEIFGFSEVGGAAVLIPRVVGVLILGQALVTNFELGVFKMLPMSAHLGMDYLVGLFLAISPVLFGFSNNATNVWLPHVVVGLIIFAQAVVTEMEPRFGRSDVTMSGAA